MARSFAQLGASRADLAEAGALPNPTFSLLFPIGPRQLELSVLVPIAALVQRPFRVKAAKLDVERAARGLLQRGLDLVRDARLAWIDVEAAKARAAARQDLLQTWQKVAKVARARHEAGDAPAFEAAAAEADATDAEDQNERAVTELAATVQRLRLVVGLADGALGQNLGTRASPLDESAPPSEATLVELALAARPDVRAAEIAVEAAGERLGWEKSRIFALLGRFDLKPIGPQGGPPLLPLPGVQVDLPIFNWNPGGIGRAEAELSTAALRYRLAQQGVATDIRVSRLQLVQALASLRRFRDRVLPLLEKAAGVTFRAFEAGAEPYLAVLEATRRLRDARLRLIDLEAEVRRARANLDRHVGMNMKRADRRWEMVLLGVLALLSSCGRSGSPTSSTQPPAKATPRPAETDLATVTLLPEAETRLGIELAPVEQRALPQTITVAGEVMVPTGGSVQLVAPFSATVSAEGDGVPKAGATVKRGQILLRLAPFAPPDRDVRAQAEKAVSIAEAQLESVKARVERLEKLITEGGASEKQVEEARAERAVLEAELAAAKKRVDTIRRAPLGADVSIPLRAPRDGVLRNVSVAPGQLVSAGGPLFEILGAPSLWVRAAVYAGEAARVPADASARVTTLGAAASPEAAVTALPVPAPPSADPASATVDLFYELPGGHDASPRRACQRAPPDDTQRGHARGPVVLGRVRRRRRRLGLRTEDRTRLRAPPRRPRPCRRGSRRARAGPLAGRAGRPRGRLRALRHRIRGWEMMRALVETCLRRRVIVLCLAVVLLILGVQRVRRIPVDVFPEFAPPRVEVQTEAPGLSSQEVEELVTTPIERALEGVPFAGALRSKSVSGLSSVVLLFEEDADILQIRQLVQERLSRVGPQLPAVSRAPVLMPPLSSTSRIMKIGLTSKTKDQADLTDLARWVVRPRLLAVPGVANVAIWGERPRQLQVVVDPAKLQTSGVRLDEVLQVARDAVVPASGGFVDTPQQRLGVTLHPGAVTAGELAQASIPRPKLGAIPLGQVAMVQEGSPPAIGDAVINDQPGLLLIVEKQPWGNTLEVTRGVEAALEALAPGMPEVEVDPAIFRPASFVERALHNLGEALLLGCVLVILVLGAFLYDLRTAFISVVAIPASLLAAAVAMNTVIGTIDTMTLAGLAVALGEVVDDAIIDVENVLRRLDLERQSASPRPAIVVVLEASLEVRSAVVHATAIVILVFLPVFFLDGLAGAFFRPLAGAYVLAILASLVVALTVTPAMCLVLLPRRAGKHHESPVARAVRNALMPAVAWVVGRPRVALAGTFGMMLAAAITAPLLGESFLPDFKENDFLMHWVAKPGTSLEELQRTSVRASKELRAIEGVRHFGAHLGRAEAADEVVGTNFAELWISVDPKVDLARTTDAVQRVVDGYPGLQRDVQTYLHERMKEVLSGGHGSIVVRIQGYDSTSSGTKRRSSRVSFRASRARRT